MPQSQCEKSATQSQARSGRSPALPYPDLDTHIIGSLFWISTDILWFQTKLSVSTRLQADYTTAKPGEKEVSRSGPGEAEKTEVPVRQEASQDSGDAKRRQPAKDGRKSSLQRRSGPTGTQTTGK